MSSVCFEIIVAAFRELCSTVTVVQFHEIFCFSTIPADRLLSSWLKKFWLSFVENPYQPPPCFVDWPEGAIEGESRFSIGHCPNISESNYKTSISVWNPVDGWYTKETVVEVLERVGPITIDDFLILSDHNETKNFNIKLDRAGTKTCIAVDFGDDDEENPEYDFYGHLKSCRIRFPHLTAEMVEPFDSFTKTFDVTHTYR